MKKIATIIALAFAATAITGFATEEHSTIAKHFKKDKEHVRGYMKAAMESLTPAEKEQLKAAHKKIESDPKVTEAREKVREAMREAGETKRAAMLKEDPKLEPILEKIEKAKKAHKPSAEDEMEE